MVADTPKAEPMSIDTMAFIRKVIKITVLGPIKPEAAQMIKGMVPQARHRPATTPIIPMTVTTFFAVAAPDSSMLPSCFQPNPCFRPYRQKIATPATRAYSTDHFITTHSSSTAQKDNMVNSSKPISSVFPPVPSPEQRASLLADLLYSPESQLQNRNIQYIIQKIYCGWKGWIL